MKTNTVSKFIDELAENLLTYLRMKKPSHLLNEWEWNEFYFGLQYT